MYGPDLKVAHIYSAHILLAKMKSYGQLVTWCHTDTKGAGKCSLRDNFPKEKESLDFNGQLAGSAKRL